MHNPIKDAFDSVHAEESLKTGTQAYLAGVLARGARKRPVRAGRFAAALACFALLLLGFSGYALYAAPVSAVSVDVNPSIELGVNRFGFVVAVEAYNDDGSALAEAVSLKHKSYPDALDALLASDAMQPYLSRGALVSIEVIGRTDAESERMRERIDACEFADASYVECRCGSRALVDDAHEARLSFGKYRAYLELHALDPDVTVEQVRTLSMREIHDRIEALCDAPQDGSGHHGNGSGRHE